MTLIGISLYGFLAVPSENLVTDLGAQLSRPWPMALYQGFSYSGIIIASLALIANLCEAEQLWPGNDDRPPGPDDL